MVNYHGVVPVSNTLRPNTAAKTHRRGKARTGTAY